MTNLIYNPSAIVRQLKELNLVDHTNIEAAMELAQEQAEHTTDSFPEGEGFGTSDFFSEVISVARDLGYTFDGRKFYKIALLK